MIIKKIMAAVLSVSAAVPLMAASAPAAGKELVYGTDYTCAAYFSSAQLTTAVPDDFMLTGTTFDREQGGEDSEGYYVSYAVLDISGVDVDAVTYTVSDTTSYGQYPVRVFVTDDSIITNTAPSGAIAGTEYANRTDLAGGQATYSDFAKVYGLTQMNITSADNTYTASIAADADYLVLTFCGWKTTKLDSLALTGTAATSDYAAEMDGIYYASFDEAMSAALGKGNKTINLYNDGEYSGSGYYAGKDCATTIKSDSDEKRTITLTTGNTNVFTWNSINLENIILKSTAPNIKNVYEYQNKASDNILTLRNCEVSDITTSDCFSVAWVNNVYDTVVSGNNVKKAVFSNRLDSVIENSTITGNAANGIGAIEVTNSSTTTIKDSTIDNNTSSYGDVNIKSGSTAVLSGNTVIGTIYFDSPESKLTLAADFRGGAELKNVSTAEGTELATVKDGALISGITVEGLDTDNYELKVQDGSLVIVKKEAEQTAKTYNAGVSNGDDGTAATSFITEVTGGSFNRIQWNVTGEGTVKHTDKFAVTTVDLTDGGTALFGLIVDGLNDADASAEVSLTME